MDRDGSDYGPPPKFFSLMAMPASSASMTPVVIMRTAVCMAVRRTKRMQSTSERRSRMSSAASSPSRPTSASGSFAPSSATRVRIASNSAWGSERDAGCGDFAEGAADFGRAIEDEPPAHARRRAGVDLVEERLAEEVGAVNRGQEMVVRGVERALIVVVGVVEADLRPGSDAYVVVVVRVRCEARQPWQIGDEVALSSPSVLAVASCQQIIDIRHMPPTASAGLNGSSIKLY